MKKNTTIIMLAIIFFSTPLLAAEFKPTWESLSLHESAPEWFKDAKFGIYFHWGVYSVPAFGSEWYPRNMHIKKNREYKHHVETYGEPAEFGYHDFVPQFKAEKFDAEQWADLFAKAGARFAGPVAEHHDGFSMWASKITPWNAKDKGPRRDIAGEIAQAVRKRGMKFVTSFHHAGTISMKRKAATAKTGPGIMSTSKKISRLCSKIRKTLFYTAICRAPNSSNDGKANLSKLSTITSRT